MSNKVLKSMSYNIGNIVIVYTENNEIIEVRFTNKQDALKFAEENNIDISFFGYPD